MRTRNGDHEIDLILTDTAGKVVAIEIKLASTISGHDVRHLAWFDTIFGSQILDRLVINTGPMAYRRADGIGVIPLALLGP